jgi:hypothetical protein
MFTLTQSRRLGRLLDGRERNETAAEAFLAELDRAVELISESPMRWPNYLHGTRRFLLRRFPFGVVYRQGR